MANVNDFLKWIKEFDRGSGLTNKVQIVEDGPEEDSGARRVRLNLFTQTHRYAICAIDKCAKRKSYLGCISYCRASYAGEDHIRSSDLTDGVLSKNTWAKIKDDILCLEFVNIGSAQYNPLCP